MNIAALTGFRFFERNRRGFELRLSWAEISGGFGLALGLCMCSGHFSLHIHIGWPNVYLRLPFLQRWYRDPFEMMESWGFSVVGYDAIHFNWGRRCKVVNLPWSWDWVRTSYLLADGATWIHDLRGYRDRPLGTGIDNHFGRYTLIGDIPKWKDTQPYRYVRRSGEVQERTATIEVEEREWRFRWFRWLPWPRNIQRTITVEFNDEIGERSGTWKGGCTGCGYELRYDETPQECLRRMERDRIF